MDHRLVAWARAVKARRGEEGAGHRRAGGGATPPAAACPGARSGGRGRGASGLDVPVLWLFTDAARAPDPRPAVAALPRVPRGLCGVVFRHDSAPDRAALARAVARLCRARGHALAVAGDARLARALGAGMHLRGGRWPGPVRVPDAGLGGGRGGGRARGWITASAHDPAELRRAARAGADAVFLSPAFATASHAGAEGLGPARWAAWARLAGRPVLALGGVDGRRVARLPRPLCAGAGAIGALLP